MARPETQIEYKKCVLIQFLPHRKHAGLHYTENWFLFSREKLLFVVRIIRCTHKQSVQEIQGGSNMTRTNCDLFTRNQSRVIFEPPCKFRMLNHVAHKVTKPHYSTGCGKDCRGKRVSIRGKDKRVFRSQQCLDWFWVIRILLSSRKILPVGFVIYYVYC
jgi:hypothetical protein